MVWDSSEWLIVNCFCTFAKNKVNPADVPLAQTISLPFARRTGALPHRFIVEIHLVHSGGRLAFPEKFRSA
jgi:hypothetical protein